MMNNKVSFTNSNNPTISLSAVIYFPPKFDETRQYQAIVVSHPGGGVKEQTAGTYAKKLAEKLTETLDTCVICDEAEEIMTRYCYTVAQMFDAETEFPKVFAESTGFCMPHFASLLKYVSYAGKSAQKYAAALTA